MGVDDELGSVQVGKFTDMIVLDQNPSRIEDIDIYGAQVLQTILGGEVVYDRRAHGNEDVDPGGMLDRLQ